MELTREGKRAHPARQEATLTEEELFEGYRVRLGEFPGYGLNPDPDVEAMRIARPTRRACLCHAHAEPEP